MSRRSGLVVLALLLLLVPSLISARSGISVLDSSVEVHFPTGLVFNLQAESSADIVDARLYYQVDRMNYARVVSEGWAEFTPSASVKTSWVWDMRRASLPPGARLTYWWTITDADGVELETPPAAVHFEDDRYRWQSLTEGNITIFWYHGDGDFARELMYSCQEGLARLTEQFGAYPGRPITIYIYASSGELRGAMVSPQEWTGGVAFTEFGIIAIGISPDSLDWGKDALVHELTHLVVRQLVFSPYGLLPVWLNEGLAMYNEGELSPELEYYLEKAVSEGSLLSVRSLCSPFSSDPEKAYLSYAESYSLVEYLLDSYGGEKMLHLLTLFKQGSTYDEALSGAYGFTLDELDARWRESLEASPVIMVSQSSEPFTSCHSDPEPFATCHSEGEKRPKNLAQGRLGEGEESYPALTAELLEVTAPAGGR